MFRNTVILLFVVLFTLFIIYPSHSSAQDLWGMTSTGGANSDGVLFEYNVSTGTYYDRTDFAGTTNGCSPYGSLIQASDGNLYGMTSTGGTNG